jgi:CheY-like chemotaxis protein
MPTILVVEDEFAVAEFLSIALREEGYQVVVARDGREGLARIADAHPDLILCDVMMPRLDGREMCHMIQADSAYSRIPIVMMSAVPEQMIRRDGNPRRRCHYAAFLLKPFSLDALLNTVADLTGESSDMTESAS